MEKLIEILNGIRPDIDFMSTDTLVDDGILDSFDIVTLVMEINEEFDIEVGVENILPENFNSVDTMLNMINNLKD